MANKTEKNAKQPGWFSRMGKKIKDTFLELKNVTWPSFPKVVRGTCVVLVVVTAFILIVTGINVGLQALLDLITGIGA